MNHRLPRWLLLVLMSVTQVFGADGRPRILTTLPPLHSWALNVAGEHADVENLLPADVGPHDFQLKPRDLQRINSADVILFNGLGLESWLLKTIESNRGKPGRIMVEAAAGLPTNALIYEVPELKVGTGRTAGHHHHHAGANPHLWLDPVFAQHAVTNLLIALQNADPAHAADYAANAAGYVARLGKLDQEIRDATRQLLRRQVVTFHDAFPYFCRRYGLELIGVIEEVPGTSPSPRYLKDLSTVIRSRGVKVIFTEPQFNPRLARQLARDLDLSVAQLDVLETGALSHSAYEDGMRKNLRSLLEALK